MKFEHTTKGLASLGRNGDNTLLHINNNEVAGLEALLGRKLSRNPETGLPEAFSLMDILAPIGIGILGAATGGLADAAGAGILESTAAGAGVGGLTGGAITASQGKGFLPGFAGGAIAGGMGGFGAEGMSGVPDSAVATSEAIPVGTKGATINVAQNPSLTTDASMGYGSMGAENPTEATNMYAPPPATPAPMDTLGKIFGSKGNLETLAKYGLPGALMGGALTGSMEQAAAIKQQQQAAQAQAAQNAQEQQQVWSNLGYPLQPSLTSADYATQYNNTLARIGKPLGYAAGGSLEMRKTVNGIPIHTHVPPRYTEYLESQDPNMMLKGYANGGPMLSSARPIPAAGMYPQSQIPQAAPRPGATPGGLWQDQQQGFASGGIASVYEKGGFLDGPGDGQSDDIPAIVDGREEVRLADGEFVVPPEIVSMVGSGDPDKGAKMFDDLLASIRMAAHGKKEQVRQDAGKLAVEKMIKRALKNGSKMSNKSTGKG